MNESFTVSLWSSHSYWPLNLTGVRSWFSWGLTPSYRMAGRYGWLILLSAKALGTVMNPISFPLSSLHPSILCLWPLLVSTPPPPGWTPYVVLFGIFRVLEVMQDSFISSSRRSERLCHMWCSNLCFTNYIWFKYFFLWDLCIKYFIFVIFQCSCHGLFLQFFLIVTVF